MYWTTTSIIRFFMFFLLFSRFYSTWQTALLHPVMSPPFPAFRVMFEDLSLSCRLPRACGGSVSCQRLSDLSWKLLRSFCHLNIWCHKHLTSCQPCHVKILMWLFKTRKILITVSIFTHFLHHFNICCHVQFTSCQLCHVNILTSHT